jgi:hypothetical protein
MVAEESSVGSSTPRLLFVRIMLATMMAMVIQTMMIANRVMINGVPIADSSYFEVEYQTPSIISHF